MLRKIFYQMLTFVKVSGLHFTQLSSSKIKEFLLCYIAHFSSCLFFCLCIRSYDCIIFYLGFLLSITVFLWLVCSCFSSNYISDGGGGWMYPPSLIFKFTTKVRNFQGCLRVWSRPSPWTPPVNSEFCIYFTMKKKLKKMYFFYCFQFLNTVCPGSSDPPEKISIIFASENEVYTIF